MPVLVDDGVRGGVCVDSVQPPLRKSVGGWSPLGRRQMPDVWAGAAVARRENINHNADADTDADTDTDDDGALGDGDGAPLDVPPRADDLNKNIDDNNHKGNDRSADKGKDLAAADGGSTAPVVSPVAEACAVGDGFC